MISTDHNPLGPTAGRHNGRIVRPMAEMNQRSEMNCPSGQEDAWAKLAYPDVLPKRPVTRREQRR
jgi:hypothetical protein